MANKSFTVQYLIKAREQYADVAAKVGRATDKLKGKIVSMQKAFVAASAKMRRAGAIMSAAVTLPLLLLSNSLKNAARDAEETRSKFATVFNELGASGEVAADRLAKSYGLAGTKARELLGNTGDLLTGFGFTQESAFDLSTKVNQLAVDLASFTNFSGGAEGASAALTKALLGERESVKSLGISILEADVKAKVAQLRTQGMRFDTLRQAKAYATLQIATEQSKNAIGDFARTQHQLANQERITSAAVQDLKESFGRILLPIVLKLTKAFRSVVEWLTELSPGVKKAIVLMAALAAVIGPLLLALGSIVLILPLLKAGFVALGLVATPAMLPILAVAALIAAAAFLIIKNWGKVSAFFSGFATGLKTTLGPTLSKLMDDFKTTAGIIVELFGGDGEAAQSLMKFANIGELIGMIIGGALDLIVRGLSGVGEIIGQLLAAIVTLDFSNFDVGAIKAQFLGPESTQALQNRSRVDVGVNVGLDQGLKQTTPSAVSKGGGGGWANVGAVTP